MNEMKASQVPGAQNVSGGLISLGSSKTPKMSINNEQAQSMMNFRYSHNNPLVVPSQSYNQRLIPAARAIQNQPGANGSSLAKNQASPMMSIPPNE